MRRLRPITVRTVVTMAATALLASGCAGHVWGSSPKTSPPAVSIAPVSHPAPPPEAPALPPQSWAGLDARVRQATSDAADSGASIEVAILDRSTGQLVTNGSNRSFPLASVVKLFIADDLLLQVAEGKTELTPEDRASLDVMLRSSDDSAAQMFWDRNGGNAIVERIVARYGLTGTAVPWNGHWDVTTSTATDLIRYYEKLLNGSGGLPRQQADIISNNIAHFTPTGTDGYPQRFGIPDGLYAEIVAVKQGWFCCWNGGNQLHVSTGLIGPDRRYIMVISSLDPTSEAAAREHLTDAVKTIFPGGRI
ncbi:Putative lipoprotein LppW [Mycolicibacterium hassiacum DSM 44199]|uniref:serine hydrolase n=1 Tax=Mycolicibacterium hassiacum TaxID=46351 RepID=UPI00047587E8|nr:serine hydrolase [Mycolicibacterium hassiacum]MBX5487230.1 serine hydrolase [Mycolicibacterium hassiacum]VCT92564.1 Putative lipoprotein LppW [Mycolicibacterium hassiacum DSM 44199]